MNISIDTGDLKRAVEQAKNEAIAQIKAQKRVECERAAERIECPDHHKLAIVVNDGDSFAFSNLCCDKLRDLLIAETGLSFSA